MITFSKCIKYSVKKVLTWERKLIIFLFFMQATDPDEDMNAEIRYHMADATKAMPPNPPFMIDAINGEVYNTRTFNVSGNTHFQFDIFAKNDMAPPANQRRSNNARVVVSYSVYFRYSSF